MLYNLFISDVWWHSFSTNHYHHHHHHLWRLTSACDSRGRNSLMIFYPRISLSFLSYRTLHNHSIHIGSLFSTFPTHLYYLLPNAFSGNVSSLDMSLPFQDIPLYPFSNSIIHSITIYIIASISFLISLHSPYPPQLS